MYEFYGHRAYRPYPYQQPTPDLVRLTPKQLEALKEMDAVLRANPTHRIECTDRVLHELVNAKDVTPVSGSTDLCA